MSHFALPIAELKPALAGLSKVIAKRSTLPLLGTIKLERTQDGWIALTATDLDHHVTVRLEQPAAGEPAALLVPYDALNQTLKACGQGEEILVERTGKITAAIKYRIGAQVVETKVESLPVEEFPEIPRIQGDAIPLPESLRTAIHEALHCASTDETRIILKGAFIDVSNADANYVVGTDGHHLYSSNSFALPLKHSLLIPSHRFLDWKPFSADGEWQLKVGVPEHKDAAAPLQLSSRRWRFISRQTEGNYPNWRQVVPGPDSYATTLELDAAVEEILQTIGRMPCDDKANYAIGLEGKNGRFALLGRSARADEYTRIEIAGVKAKGRDLRIFLNRNFLIKALQFGLTKVETIDALSPLRFSHGGRQMIVMPTRPDPAPTPAPQPTSPAPAAQNEPQAQNEPTAPEQPEERKTTMPEKTNGNTTGAKSTDTTTSEKSALETALAQIEVVRGDFRNAIAGLNKLAEALKQAQRESKTSDKEIASVRQTLRSLQSVRL